MSERHVIEAAIRGHGEAVGTVDVGRHDARGEIVIEPTAVGSKANEADFVRGFRRDVDEILRRFRCLRGD